MVKWPFLYKTLQELNYFVNSIKALYNDIGSHVANCGFLSEMFKPTRGIRQGCPLSANIFVLIVEILACAVRQHNKIQGIKIGDAEFKISHIIGHGMEEGEITGSRPNVIPPCPPQVKCFSFDQGGFLRQSPR